MLQFLIYAEFFLKALTCLEAVPFQLAVEMPPPATAGDYELGQIEIRWIAPPPGVYGCLADALADAAQQP